MLGVSLDTVDRRVCVRTGEGRTPWGAIGVPAAALAEHLREPWPGRGRPGKLEEAIVSRIVSQRTDGWTFAAIAGQLNVLRRYHTEPFALATTDTKRFHQTKALPPGSVVGQGCRAGMASRTPAHDRQRRDLRLPQRADARRDRQPHQRPGRVTPQRLAAHLAGAASGRRGVALALVRLIAAAFRLSGMRLISGAG